MQDMSLQVAGTFNARRIVCCRLQERLMYVGLLAASCRKKIWKEILVLLVRIGKKVVHQPRRFAPALARNNNHSKTMNANESINNDELMDVTWKLVKKKSCIWQDFFCEKC